MSGVIDLNQLPAPNVIESLDFEVIFQERKQRLISLYPEDQRANIEATLQFESEPIVKLLQENAYRELVLRQRVNEAARAVMVAYSGGNDLDNLAANYNVERLVIHPADSKSIPPVVAVMESDSDLRLRLPQAFEGMSVAGPTGAYEFHARSADGRVSDVSAISPRPAEVLISVLSREGTGQASSDLISIINKALNDENVRPVADRVTVQSAEIIEYQIDANLWFYPSPESEPIRVAAEQKLKQYIEKQHRLGRDIRKSAIYAALTVEGVQRVELFSPSDDVVLDKTQAAYCSLYQIGFGGYDE